MVQSTMVVISLFLLSFSCRLFGETGPEHFVPLRVGNSWKYEHWYYNLSYPQGGQEEPEPWLLKPVEIPGYPHGVDNPVPPDSLIDIIKPLTIEITHTETNRRPGIFRVQRTGLFLAAQSALLLGREKSAFDRRGGRGVSVGWERYSVVSFESFPHPLPWRTPWNRFRIR